MKSMNVFWVCWCALTLLALVSFGSAIFLVREFWRLREEKPISCRIPQLAVFQLAVASVPLFWDATDTLLHLLNAGPHSVSNAFVEGFWTVTFTITILNRIWHLHWKYSLATYEMERVWKSQFDLDKSKSWALHFSWLFCTWQRILAFSVFLSLLLFSCTSLLVYALTNSVTAVIIGNSSTFAILCVASVWALYRTNSCRDVYGVRKQLVTEFVLVAMYVATVYLLSTTLRRAHYLLYHLLLFASDVMFVAAYFFATTRLPIVQNVQFLSRASRYSESNLSLSTRTPVSPKSRKTMANALADYTSFGLLAEHCIRELSAENVLFVVAYMRLKEYMFRYLKAAGLYQVDDSSLLLQQVLANEARANNNLEVVTLKEVDSEKKEKQKQKEKQMGGTLQTLAKERSNTAAILLRMFSSEKGATAPLTLETTSKTVSASASSVSSSPAFENGELLSSERDKVKKHKFCGKLVALPTKVLQMPFGEYTLEGCVKAVSELSDKYFQFEGANCVNVSGKSREKTLDALSALRAAAGNAEEREKLWLFVEECDVILIEVMRMLKDDSFNRFIRSPEYQKWLECQSEV